MLRADPDDRPTAADLLTLSYVRKHLESLLGMDRVPASLSLDDLTVALKKLARRQVGRKSFRQISKVERHVVLRKTQEENNAKCDITPVFAGTDK